MKYFYICTSFLIILVAGSAVATPISVVGDQFNQQPVVNYQPHEIQASERSRQMAYSKLSNPAKAGEYTAKIEVRLMALEEQLRHINGRVERTEFLVEKLQQQLQENNARSSQAPSSQTNAKETTSMLAQPIVEQPSDETYKTQGVLGKTAPTPVVEPSPAEPEDQYEQAFSMLRKANYPEAQRLLGEFVQHNKKHPLTENAFYWLGETFYVQHHYEEAAIQFLRGYQQFSKGAKAPDNLLKLSLSLYHLKKKKEACASIHKLFKEFPKAPNAIMSRAKKESSRMRCG